MYCIFGADLYLQSVCIVYMITQNTYIKQPRFHHKSDSGTVPRYTEAMRGEDSFFDDGFSFLFPSWDMSFRYLQPIEGQQKTPTELHSEQRSPSDYEPPGAVSANTSAPASTTATGRQKGHQCVVREVFQIWSPSKLPLKFHGLAVFFRLQCHDDAIGTYVGSWALQPNMSVMSRAKAGRCKPVKYYCIIDWIIEWTTACMYACMHASGLPCIDKYIQ